MKTLAIPVIALLSLSVAPPPATPVANDVPDCDGALLFHSSEYREVGDCVLFHLWHNSDFVCYMDRDQNLYTAHCTHGLQPPIPWPGTVVCSTGREPGGPATPFEGPGVDYFHACVQTSLDEGKQCEAYRENDYQPYVFRAICT